MVKEHVSLCKKEEDPCVGFEVNERGSFRRVSPVKKSVCVAVKRRRVRVSDWIVCRSVCVTKFKPMEQAVNKVQECH